MLSAKLAAALDGTKGRHTPQPGQPDHLDRHTRRVLEDLLARSGVAGEPARIYLARRLRYLLGKGEVPIAPAALTREAAWIDTRAIELIDGARELLPPPDERRMRHL